MLADRKFSLYIDPADPEAQTTTTLDPELLQIIAVSLSNKDLASVARSAKGLFALFKPVLDKRQILLSECMHANPEKVSELLQTLQLDPLAMLMRGCGKEENGRKWKNVSAVEFAAWAGDTFILDSLLDHVPADYWPLALEQLKQVRDQGTEHGMHLSHVEALVKAYQERDNLFKAIGDTQINLSRYALYWFCSLTDSLAACFDSYPERIVRVDEKSLCPLLNCGLGKNFILYKGTQCQPGTTNYMPGYLLQQDTSYFEFFCDQKRQELNNRIEILEMKIANQPNFKKCM